MKTLVLSHTHGLLPFAWRLMKEGADVEVIVRKDRYERAWDGLIHKTFKGGEKVYDRYNDAVEAGKLGEVTVLTDSPKFQNRFHEAKALFGTYEENPEALLRLPVLLGGWFDGEAFTDQHLVIQDVGAWPGGLGQAVVAGVTIASVGGLPPAMLSAYAQVVDRLKSAAFRGLVQIAAQFKDPSSESTNVLGVKGGWSPVHAHAFVSELESLTDVLDGALPSIPKRFVLAVPISIPPWPLVCNLQSADCAIEGLEAAHRERIFWHDVRLVNGELRTAGLDGLIGVIRGSADVFERARAQVLLVAAAMEVPQKQFRPDATATVPAILGHLEGMGVVF